MNRITHLFNTKKHGILSVYFTAGYPSPNDTAIILKALAAKGIDMVEVGIPFSDPIADGPVIQEASTHSLRQGMTLRLLFEQLQDIRRNVSIPILLMGYLNPIMQFGFESFCRQCSGTGIDGLIIPDLPLADYIKDYQPIAERYNLKMILLITPETSEERIRLIDAHTDGFIYMVSSAATTGSQKSFDEQKQAYFRRINAMHLRNPRLVGFGISNKATYDAATAHSSGAIIGSRFIQLLTGEPSIEQAIDRLLNDLQAANREEKTAPTSVRH
jgi:tryptophan synthase alpha chain